MDKPGITPAMRALLKYKKADEEGFMVLTSRQAIHEVEGEAVKMHEALQELLQALDEPVQSLLPRTPSLVGVMKKARAILVETEGK